jgi:thiol-disulfide isomerase/thioredoxin
MSHVREISAADFDREVRQAGQPVILDFFSTECPPCEALAPKLEALAEQYAGRARILKIFRQGNRPLAEQLGVTGSPTLVFFDRAGREQDDRLGGDGLVRSAIKARLEALLADGVPA